MYAAVAEFVKMFAGGSFSESILDIAERPLHGLVKVRADLVRSADKMAQYHVWRTDRDGGPAARNSEMRERRLQSGNEDRDQIGRASCRERV